MLLRGLIGPGVSRFWDSHLVNSSIRATATTNTTLRLGALSLGFGGTSVPQHGATRRTLRCHSRGSSTQEFYDFLKSISTNHVFAFCLCVCVSQRVLLISEEMLSSSVHIGPSDPVVRAGCAFRPTALSGSVSGSRTLALRRCPESWARSCRRWTSCRRRALPCSAAARCVVFTPLAPGVFRSTFQGAVRVGSGVRREDSFCLNVTSIVCDLRWRAPTSRTCSDTRCKVYSPGALLRSVSSIQNWLLVAPSIVQIQGLRSQLAMCSTRSL